MQINYLYNVMAFSFIWLGISECLRTQEMHVRYYIFLSIGMLAIGVLSFSFDYAENATFPILRAASEAANKMVMMLKGVINSLNHPYIMTIFLLLSILVVLPRFSVSIVGYFIAGLAAQALEVSNKTNLIFLEVAILIYCIFMFKIDNYGTGGDRTYDRKAILSMINPTNLKKVDWIGISIAIIMMLITIISGKVSSWVDCFKSIFNNDYAEILEETSMAYDSLLIVSVLISFAVSACISGVLESILDKYLTDSILSKLTIALTNVIVSVWILTPIIRLLIRVYSGSFKRLSLFDESSAPDWLLAIDVPDGLPRWATIIITILIIVFIIVLLIVANAFYLALWAIIGKSLVEGIVFLFVSFFINNLFSLNYSVLGTVVSFLLLYVFNLLASMLSENAVKWSLLKRFAADVVGD